MNRRPVILSAAVAALAAGTLVTAACGGSDDTSSSTTPPATTSAATAPAAPLPSTSAPSATAPSATGGTATVSAVTILLGKPQEFSLVPSVRSVPAGKVTFTATNAGQILHEAVVVPSPGGPQSLKQPDGTSSEQNSPGEAPDVEAGQTKTFTVTLTPGLYTLVCNIPGHFANGMYAAFRVT